MKLNRQMDNYIVQPKHVEVAVSDEVQINVRDYRTFEFDKIRGYAEGKNLNHCKVNANDFIEGVANNLYKNTDMWDLLLILNGREALNELPYDNDRLEAMAAELVRNYFYDPANPYQGPIVEELVEVYKQDLLEKLTEENFNYMIFKVIDPNEMGNFLREVKYSE